MTTFTTADRLHRLVKHALDSGTVGSIAEAEAMFAGYRLSLVIGEHEARNRHCQTALLTAVALARRVFLGGVTVSGDLDQPHLTPLPLGDSLADAVAALGGHVAQADNGTAVISLDARSKATDGQFHVRPVFAGWRGGILPANAIFSPAPGPVMPLAPMLAAALAINEAFLLVSGDSVFAGRRPVGFSLWRPDASHDWLTADNTEPALSILPSRLWLIGLGHLGQAYLWALGVLPYAHAEDLSLVLQDIDIITPSTESTSVLSDAQSVGQKKTRAMATWAERRGFTTSIQERRFDATFTRQPGEPAIALCGLDNGLGRRALDQVGFDFVVEAGLGRGHRDFRAIRLHTLPTSRSATEIWKANAETEDLSDRPAYGRLLKTGKLDQCGVTLLAGKAVGAPFVGAIAATLAIAEILRLLHGGVVNELIDLDLRDIEYRTAVPTLRDFSALNPGYTGAAR